MNDFQIIVGLITLVSIIILVIALNSIDSKDIKKDDPKYRTNSPLNIFLTILLIVIIIGFILTSISLCTSRNSSRDIFIEDPIRRP